MAKLLFISLFSWTLLWAVEVDLNDELNFKTEEKSAEGSRSIAGNEIEAEEENPASRDVASEEEEKKENEEKRVRFWEFPTSRIDR